MVVRTGNGTCRTTVHPKMAQLKRMLRRLKNEGNASSVTELLTAVRSRCPHWAVTYGYVRKVLAIMEREKEEEGELANCRLFPNDLVEYRRGERKRRCWRGQVYRVADVADSDSEEEELAAGQCKVSWLSADLKTGDATSATTCKEKSLGLIDRPFVLGDRVARVQDPESLGLVVQVKSTCQFASQNVSYPEVSASCVRPMGGFRTEDLVAHEQSRWVGRVAEALYNVEVAVSKRTSSAGGRSVGKCVFKVCSEGHSMLDAVGSGCNQTTWQELCPHFTGQKVEASAKVWRQAEWLNGMPKWLSKGFNGYKTLEGTVTSIELQMLGVHWNDSWGKDITGENMPPEWVPLHSVTRLELPDSPSENWILGEHAQAVSGAVLNQAAVKPSGDSAILTRTTTLVSVRWANGQLEEDLPSTQLRPRQEFYSHDFLPHDFVARTADADEAHTPETLQYTVVNQDMQEQNGLPLQQEQFVLDDPFEPQDYGYQSDAFRNFLGQVHDQQDILPMPLRHQVARVPVGVVQSVNLQARTAWVEWRCPHRETPQEVTLFELAPHPFFELRLGDVVFIPPYLVPEAGHWIGRVIRLQRFTAQVLLGNGAVRPFDVEVLRIAACDDEGDSDTEGGAGKTEAEAEEPKEGAIEHAEGLEASEQMPMEAEVAETSGGSSSSTARPEVIAFDTFDEDLTPVDHKFVDRPSPAPKVLMRAVKREMLVLRKGLLDGEEGVVAPIMVRTYASRSDLFRAMVVGPPGTPYAHVPFFFDLAMSAQYPAEPPLVHYLSQFASSSERLNPNLYCDGKVCLSLLGTWAGPGWDPNHSTLLQVLVSLQGLVLVEDPYFNEPGHESDARSEHGRTASALYNESVRLLCLRAALNIHQQPPRGFEEVVSKHFSVYGPQILAQCEEALQGQGSEGFRQVLGRSILPKMRAVWGDSRAPNPS